MYAHLLFEEPVHHPWAYWVSAISPTHADVYSSKELGCPVRVLQLLKNNGWQVLMWVSLKKWVYLSQSFQSTTLWTLSTKDTSILSTEEKRWLHFWRCPKSRQCKGAVTTKGNEVISNRSSNFFLVQSPLLYKLVQLVSTVSHCFGHILLE